MLPFFEHLAPEGWLRARQGRAGGTADQDDFGLLLRYGEDCIGAVGILPPGGPLPVTVNHENSVEQAASAAGRTLSGVQKKLLAYRGEQGFAPSLHFSNPATHIAKLNHDDLPTLVQNENLSLSLAREILGVAAVTKAEIKTLQGVDGIALIVERFDRRNGERLRLEDFAQILGKPRGREFDGKYQSSYEEAATVIAEYSALAKIDLLRYFELLIFNFVIGNADAHLKNFSLLERPEGLRLSPAYDLVNILVYPNYDRQIALALGGKKLNFDQLDREVVERFGTDIGLTKAVINETLNKLAKKFNRPKSLQFADNVQPNDFRISYRDVVFSNAERIFS